ncbi:NRAMP family divalent metal transporter [Sinorhizobium meliloti]|uniref:NRAMP family divalent metal transporter n=1 Tax=Rhizobium meliloti TaxID=382 RepID=UPI000FDC262B|nr:divalent metal cation transporter [Sinorhizobium meliloti]RVL94202.1 divalent metal cation transporter [Sinorhizobium meliloti]
MGEPATEASEQQRPTPNGAIRRFLRTLGPGFIAGASDDDPAGIGTYSQAGAQFGFGIGWTMLLTYPLMSAIQQICARIGRTTGHGIAGNLCRHYPGWLLYSVVGLLFTANTINIGADLSAMADALKLLIGGPSTFYVIAFGSICALASVYIDYDRYVAVLKWLTLSLFSYVAALFVVNIPWGEAVASLFVPKIIWNAEFFTTVVAIFGTTISPYLFFWQASQEAEDERVNHSNHPLVDAPKEAPAELKRIRADTLIGMAFSTVIAVAIIVTTAATLNKTGITDIESSAQAAEALRPIAGNFAFAVFAFGIVGTGLLAVPVLAGAAAYAVGEAFKWPVGLARKPKHAKAFYSTLVMACVLGMGILFTPINPIKALYWSAVINGVVAVPVMAVMMLMTAKQRVMGKFTISGWLRWLGWAATVAMTASVLGMAVTSFG